MKDLAHWIAPGATALIIVDMQRDFADVPGGGDALAQTARLAQAARAAGVACIFTALETRPETDSAAWRERLARLGRNADKEMNLCREGSSGAQFAGPQPHPGDLVIAKRRYSGFFGTGLEAALKERGRHALVICGLTTECCVAATARDAFERDFDVFIARDACAGAEEGLHQAALAILARDSAILVQSDDILRAWRSISDKVQ